MIAGEIGLWPKRYHLLDAWRGLAALVVVLAHTSPIKLGGYGVTIFFVISGYCIAAAAEGGVVKQTPVRQFMWRRVRRIYPPYAFSLVFFVATRLVKLWLMNVNDLHCPWYIWVQNFTMTQWLTYLVSPGRTDNPALLIVAHWSINFEEQFYLLVALVLWLSLRRRRMFPAMLIGLTVATLPYFLLFSDGWYTGFFVDYWVLFGVGTLVYLRLCCLPAARARHAIDAGLVCLTAAAGVLWWLASTRSAGLSIWGHPLTHRIDELFVAGCFALLLIGTRRFDAWFDGARFSVVLKYLGLISYSLYLVHQFNLQLVEKTVHLVLPTACPMAVTIPFLLAGHVVIASIFWYFCERPFLNTVTSIWPKKPRHDPKNLRPELDRDPLNSSAAP